MVAGTGKGTHKGVAASGVASALLGLVVLVVPFVTEGGRLAFWNDVLVGVLIAALSLLTAWLGVAGPVRYALWPAVTAALLGVWLAGVAFMVEASGAAFRATVVAAVLVVAFSGYAAWVASSAAGPEAARDATEA